MYFINSQMEGMHRAATGSATLPKSPQFTGWKAPNSFFSSHFSCRFSFLRGGGRIPITCLWDHCWLHRVSDWPELLWVLCVFSRCVVLFLFLVFMSSVKDFNLSFLLSSVRFSSSSMILLFLTDPCETYLRFSKFLQEYNTFISVFSYLQIRFFTSFHFFFCRSFS